MVRMANYQKLRVPLALSFFAPVSVIFCLNVLHSVWWTLVVYQLGCCLIFPAVESTVRKKSGVDHLQILGLVQVEHVRPGIRFGSPFLLSLGAAFSTALITGAFLWLTKDSYLSAHQLGESLSHWGVEKPQMAVLLVIMALLNAPAEELFWRGYLPGRMGGGHSKDSRNLGLAIVLPATLYASYHLVTLGSLVSSTLGATLMFLGVWFAGMFWGWLRQRTGSVWPPLMSHWGAVLAYLGVHYWLTS